MFEFGAVHNPAHLRNGHAINGIDNFHLNVCMRWYDTNLAVSSQPHQSDRAVGLDGPDLVEQMSDVDFGDPRANHRYLGYLWIRTATSGHTHVWDRAGDVRPQASHFAIVRAL